MESGRLDKIIADFTVKSRKDAKAFIRRGAVGVNGVVVTNPDMKISKGDKVTANGKLLSDIGNIYIMMNKPTGVLSATRDNQCKTVLDLLPENLRRKGLFPAGRLDKDTEGFVLITDDGEFAHRILAPKNHVPKTYYAELSGHCGLGTLKMLPAKFAEGLTLDGGDRTSPAELAIIRDEAPLAVRLVIYEGMYHQVKRMFALFALEVTYLRREAIGGLSLDSSLKLGAARVISEDEIAKLG